jgi:demethylmenaquinone methyltransferase/2-methoxy-6-polyprenyl-1,4-benzoquinol methylase
MSTYILMKILESAPHRYDRGIKILTLGSLDSSYDRIASHFKEGDKVLDIGCGTGALTLRAALAGAKVKGIDINPEMLDILKKREKELELTEQIETVEMGVAELGSEKGEQYDVVMSGLCFSELSSDELRYTLKEAKRILKPKGLLLLADEVVPHGLMRRVCNAIIRLPLIVITYILTQTTTHAVKNLSELVEEAGFVIESRRFSKLGSFMEIVAGRPEK